jgi:GNAT superfamily N-acetyltransferase
MWTVVYYCEMHGDATFDLSAHHFGRFTRTAEADEAAIADARTALAQATGDEATVEAEVSLGEALTVARREDEALGVLIPAVGRARSATVAPEVLGWALLMLATAEHYADRPDDAASRFDEALRIARQASDESLEHYCLHHLGRFLVDQGQRDLARAAFASCLVIRERVADPRAARTREAIAALDAAHSLITVAPLQADDRTDWQELFTGYHAFYGRTWTTQDFDHAWRRFEQDPRIHALGARHDGRLVGIAHFLVHASTTSPDVCYLQDLFTAPDARGKGVARTLIGAVEQWARAQGCARLYWHTQQRNDTARRLYDGVAEFRGFIVYTMPL